MDLFKLIGRIAIENGDANKEIDATTGKAEGASGKMMGAFKKVGGVVATAFAVDKIKDFGLGCINAASDAGAASSQFTQVFGNLESQASKNLKGIADTAGITENRMKGSYTKIAAFAKTTGADTKTALGIADRAMIAVADSAAFYDRSLEDTTESLQSFLKGNYENDAALGLSCTETTRNAAANKLYGKSFKDLSEEQKQLTLLQMVEDANKASGALGQAARESNTWTNVTGNLKQSWTDFQAELGKPILEKVNTFVGNLASKVTDLTKKITEGNNPVQKFIDKLKSFYNWAKDIGSYASSTFKPVLDDLKNVFTKIKDAVQPLIDRFKEYVSSGEASEDITNRVKDTIDLLGAVYEDVSDAIKKVVDGFKDAYDWCKKNETAVQLIAIGIGTLTAAIGAYNIAMAIKNAGGIVELAQLALLQVQLWGLSAAQAVATTATTLWGAAINFACSPVTLIILGIGALIAIFVLLWKNCDGFREFFLKMWDTIKQKWSECKPYFEAIWEGIKTAFSIAINFILARFKLAWEGIKLVWGVAVEYFKLIWNNIKAVFSVVKTYLVGMFKTAWEGIKLVWAVVGGYFKAVWNTIKGVFKVVKSVLSGDFKGAWEAIKGIVGTWANYFKNIWNQIKNVFSSVKSWFGNTFKAAWSAIKDIWSNVGSFFSNVMSKVKNTFSKAKDIIAQPFKTAIDKIKGFFKNLKLKFPNIKLPHFKVTGKFDLKKMTVPKLSIDWYKKAMNNAMILNSPTIFGYDSSSGNLMGGGEAGSEVVAGSQTLMNMIQSAVAEQNGEVTNVLGLILKAICSLDDNLALKMKDSLQAMRFEINDREFARLVKGV